MLLHHEVTVPAPLDEVWPALLDIEGIAPCLPGAAVDSVEDDTVTGSVTVKVGPITVAYRGTAVIRDRNPAAHRIVVQANGRQQHGPGTARATMTATVAERDDGTSVAVDTDLTITGRPAQFGRGVIDEVGDRMMAQFATRLAERLAAPADGTLPAPAAIEPEPLDLLNLTANPRAKRAAAALLAAVVVFLAVLRMRRHHR